MVAARIATEKMMEIRWNLRALGVPIDGPVMMYGDNQSVILSSTMPSSVLKKKHLSCCYFRIREAIAARIIRFEYVKSSRNYADLMTKPLPRHEFKKLVDPLLFRNDPNQTMDEKELVLVPDEIEPEVVSTRTPKVLSPFPRSEPMTVDPVAPPVTTE